MPPAEFVLLPRDLPWERAYDREDANAPQIAKLRLALPADYPAGTVLKLPMPCACSEHTSRFTKIKAGTSVVIKWDLGICGLAAPPEPQLNSELSSSELIRSERSSTGFKGVSIVGSGATPFGVQVYRKGTSVILGRYATAEEGARAYAATPEGIADLAARDAPPPPPLPSNSELSSSELIRSERSSTGFKCVSKVGSGATPYRVQVYRKGKTVTLGHFSTAEEGARGVYKVSSGATPYYAQVYRKGTTVILGRYATAEEAALRYARSVEGKAELAASGGVEYLVAWKGCYAPSWEPASNLADEDGAVCAALLAWCASRVAPHQGGPATELGMPAAEPLPPLGMPAVVQALEGVGLGRYAAAFEEQGYDDLRYLRTMDAAERATVAESVGMKQGHADKFVKFAFEPA
ncbi:hypothetical protein EMIHUDRAFT_204950 [Emiliania huxleyi CCMP1516]|uniref:Chromo domain-containing protein n=2 Tax=Emiliania huxleyi TaxID=2903 RepID=A0A0D3JU77_EMIH1|nr:hypothetical protein EMIHUDRAFT_204950 [Emiliania huxleyi CCMP1516]EOD27062.1 hypothetical protein EMIHUDRAFT_204950 [Emiliania huxleyi CCMP1516]|eukprot:XP_005779491.1 hypothetical protein EMIHUDRAFT_204950 [Emiliania huxleyi CCMP1516]